MNKNIKIKFCGMTRVEDAAFAAKLGVDAIGLIFYPASPRHVDVNTAAEICRGLPPFVNRVGVFVNANVEQINTVLKQVPIDTLQFHGDESPAFCDSFNLPYIKVIRFKPDVDLEDICSRYNRASGILLDTYQKSVPGGTGETFAWEQVPDECAKPIILAGGLTVDNVAAAIGQVQPYAVDVVSGIEAEKGLKDHEKMQAFVDKVRYDLRASLE